MKTEKIKIVFGLVVAMWVVYFLDTILSLHLNSFGLVPRTVRGLIGIVTSPFLHASFFHLVGNTLPFLVLCILLVTIYERIAFQVLTFIALVGGGMVWLLGRSANHIGASGLIYGTASFLMVYGILKKKVIPILIALVVVFLYGGTMITGILPLKSYISWEGHLFCALAGALAAKVFNKK